MSLVIASSLSQLAVRRGNAGGFHGFFYPFLGVGVVGGEIRRFRLRPLAQERQMRLEVVCTRGAPFGVARESGDRFLAGIEEIRHEALVLNPLIAAADLDRIVI